jgi:hypothetical protein
MPILTTLPSGATMFVSGVVSHDRRYVRVTPSPNFTGVGAVTTFNLQQGTTGTSAGPGTGGTQPGGTPPGATPGTPGTGGAS